jgi:protocatechuate 3,4-dioxygenase beta subunit
MKYAAAAILGALLTAPLTAQDPEFVRAWELAQRNAPRTIGWTARIAPANEPGTPMVIHGQVFQKDGVSPAPGVVVFAYQTDRGGQYNVADRPDWRLRGWARTDAKGRFEFHTIRPGSYPTGGTAAHVHITIHSPSLHRRWTPELQFTDDPLVSQRDRQRPAAMGKFGGVRPVTKRNGVQHVEYNIRIDESGRF